MPELPGGPREAAELRALGEEWRGEWPDGRVCKAELNRIADRLNGREAAIRADQTQLIAAWLRVRGSHLDEPRHAEWRDAADAIERGFGGGSDVD